jgi:glycosyltransferase involved in cell wall biosynthesis
MKLYVNRKPVNGPWGGGNMFVKACYQVLGHPDRKDVEMFLPDDPGAKPDVILLAGTTNDGVGISADQAIMHKLYHRPDMKIVLRVNENDARKATEGVDENLIKLSEHIDATVFVSDWLQDYFMKKGWKCENNMVIHNGVDQELFVPQEKLGNSKINIVTHHWSDNYLKGFDIYEDLDEFVNLNKDFTFTYIGRHRHSFSNETNIVKPLAGKKLAEELGKYDVYVSASRFDPGPNHILESLACKIPTYVYKDGGGCIEFAGDDHVFNSWEELETLLLTKKFEQNTQFELPTWNDCIEKYASFLEEVCKS